MSNHNPALAGFFLKKEELVSIIEILHKPQKNFRNYINQA